MARIVSPTMPPGAHALGDIWYHTLSGLTFEWQRTAAGFGVWVQKIIAGPLTVSVLAPVISGTPLCTSSPIAPDNPDPCDLWYHTESGVFFIYYDDGDTRQWVTTQPTKVGDIIVVTGPAGGDLAGSYPNPTIRPDVELIRPTTETLPASDVDTLELVPAQWVNDKFNALPPLPTTLPPSGPAGGALAGTYPDPSLAVPYPTTLPPSGPAGGQLAGTYPNPTIAPGVIPVPPTTLPPSGPAGGALAGTYPNPSLAVPYPTTLPPNGPAGGQLAGTYPNPTIAPGVIPTTLPPSGAAGGALTGNYPSPTLVGGPLTLYAPLASPALTGTPTAPDLTGGSLGGQLVNKASLAAAIAAGASITVGVLPPPSPNPNQLWWNSETGVLFLYYNDGNTSQWVPASPSGTAPGQLVLYSESVLVAAAADIRVAFPANAKMIRLEWFVQPVNATDQFNMQELVGSTPQTGATHSAQVMYCVNPAGTVAQTLQASGATWIPWGGVSDSWGKSELTFTPFGLTGVFEAEFIQVSPAMSSAQAKLWGGNSGATGMRIYFQSGNVRAGSIMRSYVVT